MKRDPNNKKPTKLLTSVTALLLAVGFVSGSENRGGRRSPSEK